MLDIYNDQKLKKINKVSECRHLFRKKKKKLKSGSVREKKNSYFNRRIE